MEPRGPDKHLGEILFIVNIFFQLGTDAKITIQFVCYFLIHLLVQKRFERVQYVCLQSFWQFTLGIVENQDGCVFQSKFLIHYKHVYLPFDNMMWQNGSKIGHVLSKYLDISFLTKLTYFLIWLSRGRWTSLIYIVNLIT